MKIDHFKTFNCIFAFWVLYMLLNRLRLSFEEVSLGTDESINVAKSLLIMI